MAAFANLRDGPSYLHLASALLGRSSELTPFDRRVFVGYPALVASFSLLGGSVAIAALTVNWLCSGVAASLAASLFRNKRVGWAMVFFPPSLLTYSTLAMSEASLLALTLAGLVVARRGRWVVAGILLGYAGLIRPVACFAVLGLMTERWCQRRRVQALGIGALAATVVVTGYILLQLWTGDALGGVRVYAHDERAFNGHLFGWPFESLMMTPLRYHIPVWKIAYVWPYVIWTLAGCYLAIRAALSEAPSDARALSIFSATWLVTNTIFVLCIGHIWGFHDFNRHILGALPPLLWVYRKYIPTRVSIAIPASLGSVLLGLVGLLRSG